MIKSFRDKTTAALYAGHRSRRLPPEIQLRARRKLLLLDAADGLEVLASNPANRLERLRGDRQDQWSLRINAQWRLCFRWVPPDAWDVEITDYH